MQTLTTRNDLVDFLGKLAPITEVTNRIRRIYAFARAYESGAKGITLKDVETECETSCVSPCFYAIETSTDGKETTLYVTRLGKIAAIDLTRDSEAIVSILERDKDKEPPF